MIEEVIGRIRECVALLDGVLYPVDVEHIYRDCVVGLERVGSKKYDVPGVARVAVNTLDDISHSYAHDSVARECLDNLANEIHALTMR